MAWHAHGVRGVCGGDAQVLIEDSFMFSGDGGNNHGHVHHITYRRMVLNTTHLGFFLKTGDNKNNWDGHVYAMRYENIEMHEVDNGFVIDQLYGTNQKGTTTNVSMHDITLENVTGTVVGTAICLDCALNASDGKLPMCTDFTLRNISLRPSPLAQRYGRNAGFFCEGPKVSGIVHDVTPFDPKCFSAPALSTLEARAPRGLAVKRLLTSAPGPGKCGQPCACEITPAGLPCKGGWANGCLPLPCSQCDATGCNWCNNGTCSPAWGHQVHGPLSISGDSGPCQPSLVHSHF